MLKRHRQLIAAVAMLPFLITSQATATMSDFINISKINEAEFGIKVKPIALKNQQYVFQIETPEVDELKHAWLIVCKSPLKPEQRQFRAYVWSYPYYDSPEQQEIPDWTWKDARRRLDILIKAPIVPSKKGIIQFTLHIDLIPQSYIYIDFPFSVADGGNYYSIDLASYVKEPKEK